MHWVQFQLLIWNILGAAQHAALTFLTLQLLEYFSTYDQSDNWMQGKLLISIHPRLSAN